MRYSPKNMKDNLEEKDFSFKKKFGQNFITDENIIDSILSKADIKKDTFVLEVGPGAGSLTYKLCDNASFVLCYEIDDHLKDVLTDNLKDKNNYKVIYNDFLKADVQKELKNYTYSSLYLVANLPYYITTPIITKVIEDHIPVEKMVVMVQKEVGDRFRALPGSKAYNSLTIYLNYYFDIKKIMDVSKNVFMPKPNVDSIVVLFTRKKESKNVKDESLFFKLVRDSFTQKRKTLRNNLKGYDLKVIEEVLQKYGYDLSVRAESLSIDIFIDIANHL